MLDLRDGASTSHLRLSPLITGQPSSVAIGSEKPTTPCKCCASITGKWWTGRRRRGTGPSAPKIYSSNQDRRTLAAVGNPSFRSPIMTSAWNPSNVCAELLPGGAPRRTPEETKAHLDELQR